VCVCVCVRARIRCACFPESTAILYPSILCYPRVNPCDFAKGQLHKNELLNTNPLTADVLQEAVDQKVLSVPLETLQPLLQNFVGLHQTCCLIQISDKYLFIYIHDYGITL
jgi:hypothetical protein